MPIEQANSTILTEKAMVMMPSMVKKVKGWVARVLILLVVWVLCLRLVILH